MHIRTIEYDDPEYCACGGASVATLESQGMQIALCFDCLKELTKSMNDFNSVTRCYQCKHFGKSNCGWQYGGTCLKEAAKAGKVIPANLYGNAFCRDGMDTCNEASKA